MFAHFGTELFVRSVSFNLSFFTKNIFYQPKQTCPLINRRTANSPNWLQSFEVCYTSFSHKFELATQLWFSKAVWSNPQLFCLSFARLLITIQKLICPLWNISKLESIAISSEIQDLDHGCNTNCIILQGVPKSPHK